MNTLKHKLNDFLDHYRSLNYSPRTLYSFKRKLLTFLQYLEHSFHVTTADQIRKKHLHTYQNHLACSTSKRGIPLKPGSINNCIRSVRVFLAYLYLQTHITTDFSREISYVKQPSVLPTSVLTHTQMKRLLTQIHPDTPINYRNRTVMELLYSCGLRRSELLGLTLADADLDQGLLTVMGKGKKQRVVPIGKTALRFLEGYIKGIRPFWKNNHTTNALFLGQYGNPLDPNGMRWIVDQCSSKAPVRVTPHTLRRSCTTELIRGNANLYHVKDFLGHASLETLKPYTKLTINDLKKTHAKCHPREKDE